ncbi:nuclear transport factor 2 family protein [Pseudomonas zhanjiangensis]|uniref:Nuclear transport factor 2 family protein n=1 Tax=Pseudomonas zhanjiangensis TaxID=3239015 RepID=A0ABV3YSI4_9PSED
MSDYLRHFGERFASLDKNHLDHLGELYSEDVVFSDPLHQVRGLSELRDYFTTLYASVHDLRFDFHGCDQVRDGEGYLRWTLSYRHPRLAGGQSIRVEGCSHLLWRDRVHQHRDYFDAGALLYEQLPLLGGAIRWLKWRLA